MSMNTDILNSAYKYTKVIFCGIAALVEFNQCIWKLFCFLPCGLLHADLSLTL